MAESIEQLRIYQSSRRAEDQVYELVKEFPADQFYGLGNDLRRSSAAVSHHIAIAHKQYSYRLKLEELSSMRHEAEVTQKHLESAQDFGDTSQLSDEYTIIIKQSWGLTKWLRSRSAELALQSEIRAKEQSAALVS